MTGAQPSLAAVFDVKFFYIDINDRLTVSVVDPDWQNSESFGRI
jgi:hypothetical protein